MASNKQAKERIQRKRVRKREEGPSEPAQVNFGPPQPTYAIRLIDMPEKMMHAWLNRTIKDSELHTWIRQNGRKVDLWTSK